MNARVEHDAKEHSLRELFGRLSHETMLLAKEELDLAKAEIAQRTPIIGTGAIMLVIAATLGLLAVAALTTAVILALALALAAWAAALIVAVAYGLGAALLALAGAKLARKAWPLAPQTIETVKENIEWAQTRAKSPLT